MHKQDRARVILSQVRSMIPRRATIYDVRPKPGEISEAQVQGRWSGLITWGSAKPGLEPAGVPVEQWDILHIRAAGEIKLALRFYEHKVDIIVFKPGPWERWFTTFDLSDGEVIAPD